MGGLIIDYDGTIIDLSDQSQVVKLNTDSLNAHHALCHCPHLRSVISVAHCLTV